MLCVNFVICIFQAEELIVSQKLDKEYLPISGNAEFCKEAIKLALGDNNPVIADGLVCIIYCVMILSCFISIKDEVS